MLLLTDLVVFSVDLEREKVDDKVCEEKSGDAIKYLKTERCCDIIVALHIHSNIFFKYGDLYEKKL